MANGSAWNVKNALPVNVTGLLTYKTLPYYTSGIIGLVKQGNLYFFSFELSLQNIVSGATICQLDASICPSKSRWINVDAFNTAGTPSSSRLILNADGTLNMYDVTGTRSITGSYLCVDA